MDSRLNFLILMLVLSFVSANARSLASLDVFGELLLSLETDILITTYLAHLVRIFLKILINVICCCP